jgi:hypothetical protein
VRQLGQEPLGRGLERDRAALVAHVRPDALGQGRQRRVRRPALLRLGERDVDRRHGVAEVIGQHPRGDVEPSRERAVQAHERADVLVLLALAREQRVDPGLERGRLGALAGALVLCAQAGGDRDRIEAVARGQRLDLAGRRGRDLGQRVQAGVGQHVGVALGERGRDDEGATLVAWEESRPALGLERTQRLPSGPEGEDLLGDGTAGAADRRQAVVGQGQEPTRDQEPGAVERVAGSGRQRQRGDRRVGGDRADRLVGQRRGVGFGRHHLDLRAPVEASEPGVAHGARALEALRGGPAERGGEEPDQGRAGAGVEPLGGDLEGAVVAADRAHAGEDLVEGDGGAEPVGRVVPHRALGQERISVGGGANPQVGHRRRRQREIEQVQRARLPGDRADAEVGRLDVAVDDLLLFEMLERGQQVLAPPAGVVEAERALVGQLPVERVLAGQRHEQAGALGERVGGDQAHDARMVEALEDRAPRPAGEGRARGRATPSARTGARCRR